MHDCGVDLQTKGWQLSVCARDRAMQDKRLNSVFLPFLWLLPLVYFTKVSQITCWVQVWVRWLIIMLCLFLHRVLTYEKWEETESNSRHNGCQKKKQQKLNKSIGESKSTVFRAVNHSWVFFLFLMIKNLIKYTMVCTLDKFQVPVRTHDSLHKQKTEVLFWSDEGNWGELEWKYVES